MNLRATFLLSFAGLFLLTLGAFHYGVDALAIRIEYEITSRRSHPQYVPTPSTTAAAVDVSPLILPPTESDTPTGPVGSSVATPPAMATEPAPTVAVAPLPAPQPLYQPVLPAVALAGFRHEWQTWNNCGPATLAMNLSYFGSTLHQANVADVLRPNRDDKNVSPEELVQYARNQGYNATLQVNGTPDLLRLLLSNSIPVIVETWHIPEPDNGMGHYRLLTGYDEAGGRWIAHDAYDKANPVNPNQTVSDEGESYLGEAYQGIYLPYAETGDLWEVFNRVFVVVYTDAQASLVQSILGERMNEAFMWQQAVLQAQVETRIEPENAFAWFNLGSDLVALGQYEQAAAVYDHARQLGLPWRMLWYQFGPLNAYYEIGRYDEVITLADATLQNVSHVEELHYWKGRALLAQGNVDEARRSFQQAVDLNRNYLAAVTALADL